MRYVIVDLDGASRDYFQAPDAVRSALRDFESDGGAVEDLFVVAYDANGDRLGSPVRGDDWLRIGSIQTGTTVKTKPVPVAKSRQTAGASTGSPAVLV